MLLGAEDTDRCALPTCRLPSFCRAQASKSLLNAGPTSATMSVVVVERPCFWKAWWLHCLVREHAPKAATSRGLRLGAEGTEVSRAEARGQHKHLFSLPLLLWDPNWQFPQSDTPRAGGSLMKPECPGTPGADAPLQKAPRHLPLWGEARPRRFPW